LADAAAGREPSLKLKAGRDKSLRHRHPWLFSGAIDAVHGEPAVGDTVDVANATWTDTIGDPSLAGTWTDPDFDPAQRAFYYARVIEIPTPRWTAYDALRFGIEMSPEVPMKQQERAWASPIWYTP